MTARPPAAASRLPRVFACAVAAFAVAAICLNLTSVHAQEVPQLQIHSKRYIVIDADTGEVFAQRNAHEEVAIASLTKVFTTIEALERGNLDQVITTHNSDVFDPTSSTVMGFGPGESFTLRDLLYGMMLPSGNDAAHAIARALGYQKGDTDAEAVARFVGEINERIKNMGLTETHLVRPDGWGVKGHYSSAHDLAVFTMYALQYPMFVDLISTSSYTTSDGSYTVTNTNKMLNTYQDLIGGKTGYDDDAGYCLIEVARRDGNTMISVTLDGIAPDDWYDDDRVLLDYAFDQKEARVAAKRPITGEILGFRDPDAARLQTQATPGASVGQPDPTATSSSSPVSDTEVGPTAEPATPTSDPTNIKNSGGPNWKLVIAATVAAIVIVAGVAGSVAGGSDAGEPPGGD
jgi:D-alanyl-D-alanine carboxypeptidase (penicillin-binding protein 5/6)